MPIPALIAPALVSLGIKAAGKLVKAALKPTESSPTPAASRSFEELLKQEQSRSAAPGTSALALPALDLLSPPNLLSQLGHEQGVRSLALGLQTRLRNSGAAPAPDAARFSLAGRLAGKLRLDSIV
ncbi:MAG TPA: hypothetical protein VMI34_14315 [Candidatus Bathyarchaeia archaeon]|nr:hypothetical protein [Candidatus Bathyarchaeia archaeon]